MSSQNINNISELNHIKKQCKDMVRKRARIAAGTSLIPLPFVDVAADMVSLANLIPKITKKFQLEVDDDEVVEIGGEKINKKTLINRIKSYTGLASGRVAVKRSVRMVTNRSISKRFLKYVPFSGQLIAGGISYFTVKQIANDHIEDCYKKALKQLHEKKGLLPSQNS